MENIQVEQLVFLAKEGDENAVNEIYARYKPLVRSVCKNFFQLGGEKDDLLQEGMIGLFGAINNFDAKRGNFTAFASRCIRNRVLTSISKGNSEKNKNETSAQPLGEESGTFPPPDGEVESSEALCLIQGFIKNNLSQAERTVIEYILQGYSHSEICGLTAKSYKSVDAALQRARKKLKSYKEKL